MESTLAHSRKISVKEKEGMNGTMVNFIRAIGKRERRMAMASGSLQMETAMLAIG
jgi:hypothetical protein